MNILNSYLRKKEIILKESSLVFLPNDSFLIYTKINGFIKRELYINKSMIYFLYYYNNKIVSSKGFRNDRCA